MRLLPPLLLLGCLVPTASVESAPVSERKEAPGIKRIQLVTDTPAITPGETFTVALVIEPEPSHHTYWKGPGIVGVATSFKWDLPDGFTAGDVIWPAPGKVDMAGITAYGYKSNVMLLTEIQSPRNIAGSKVTLDLKTAWMACARSCNPGVAEFSLVLPVSTSGTISPKDPLIAAEFEATRQTVPLPAPESWTINASLPQPDRIQLDLTIPGLRPESMEGIYFYCHDLQVDSDAAQAVSITDPPAGGFRLTLVRPVVVAPSSSSAISGVLFCPDGWPGMDSRHVEISALWPEGTFNP